MPLGRSLKAQVFIYLLVDHTFFYQIIYNPGDSISIISSSGRNWAKYPKNGLGDISRYYYP